METIIDQVVEQLEKEDLPEKVEIAAMDKVPCPF